MSLRISTVFRLLHIPTWGQGPSCLRFSQQLSHLIYVSVLSVKCAWTIADKVIPVANGKLFNLRKRNGDSLVEGSLPQTEQVPCTVVSMNFLVISSFPQWASLATLKSSNSMSSSCRTPSSALKNSSASCCVLLSRYSFPEICETYVLTNAVDFSFPTEFNNYTVPLDDPVFFGDVRDSSVGWN